MSAAAVGVVGLLALTIAIARFLGLLSAGAAPPILLAVGIAALFGAVLLQRGASQREIAAGALATSQAQVSQILEAAMDPIITTDAKQRIVMFNAAAERVFHWPRSAVIGQKLEMLIPERFREAHRTDMELFGATGQTTRRMGGRQALWALRANGEEFPIEASISHLHVNREHLFTVILRDITERMQGELALSRSEARLRGILESAMDAIVTIDQNQKIVLFNEAAEKMFACSREEAIGAPLSWFIPERYRATHAENVRRFGETGVTSRRMAGMRLVTGLARDGREFPIDASISQIQDDTGHYYTVILRDITRRLESEEALRRSKQELQEVAASASAAREQEQSGIARELHDELGQALTALKMMVAAMERKSQPGDKDTQERLRKMRSLIDETLAATRRIASELRPLMLDDLGIVPALEGLVEGFVDRTGMSCKLDIDRALALPDAQKTAVFRIVQEALTNIARHAKATVANVSIGRSEGAVVVEVQDNGIGFEVGDSRRRQSRGLLGMRERAYLLGGQFEIESTPGQGTRLTIHIPLETMVDAS